MRWLPWLVSFRYSIASELQFWVDQNIWRSILRGRRTGKSCVWLCQLVIGQVEKPNLTRISLNVESSRYANVCAVYLLVYQFVTDISTKFTSDCIASLSAMVQPERPHINVHSKMDLVTSKKDINKYTFHGLLFASRLEYREQYTVHPATD